MHFLFRVLVVLVNSSFEQTWWVVTGEVVDDKLCLIDCFNIMVMSLSNFQHWLFIPRFLFSSSECYTLPKTFWQWLWKLRVKAFNWLVQVQCCKPDTKKICILVYYWWHIIDHVLLLAMAGISMDWMINNRKV